MLFKPKYTAALLICLGLAARMNVANAQASVDEPIAVNKPAQGILSSTEGVQSSTEETQFSKGEMQSVTIGDILGPNSGVVGPEGDYGVIGDLLTGAIWPLAFTQQCNSLLQISNKLDCLIAQAKAKNNYSCTQAQIDAMGTAPKCSAISYVYTIVWPLAFIDQETLAKRIAAQADCLAGFEVTAQKFESC
ncbi:hypothetical protein BGX28_006104 [Mortierella sp. GBA30]|nr:hypothetical protein BGX28_006104 [Mortierella sp. GBA30]